MSPHYFCKRGITLMSSLLLLVVLQQAGGSAVVDDCESKVGSELWLSRHLAGKGQKTKRGCGYAGIHASKGGICNCNEERKSSVT